MRALEEQLGTAAPGGVMKLSDVELSDLTAAVEFPLAEQAMARLGEDAPADDELDEVWPVGDLELFSDLGLPEDGPFKSDHYRY